MCLLAVFACMNAAFFPGGDVLLTFSLAGLLLVPCRRLKTSSLVALSLFFLGSSLPVCCGIVRFPEIRRGYGKFLGDGLGEPDYRTMGQPGMGY